MVGFICVGEERRGSQGQAMTQGSDAYNQSPTSLHRWGDLEFSNSVHVSLASCWEQTDMAMHCFLLPDTFALTCHVPPHTRNTPLPSGISFNSPTFYVIAKLFFFALIRTLPLYS